MYSVRPVCRSLPESAGKRDALHPLGGSKSASALGRWSTHRRIQLRLLRPLCVGLSVQRTDGENNARASRIPHGLEQARARRHDRRGEGSGERDGYTAILKVSEVESAMLPIASA